VLVDRGLNLRPPAQQSRALPTELTGVCRRQAVVACVPFKFSWRVSCVTKTYNAAQVLMACVAFQFSWRVSPWSFHGVFRPYVFTACVAFKFSRRVSPSGSHGVCRPQVFMACVAFKLSWRVSPSRFLGVCRLHVFMACVAFKFSGRVSPLSFQGVCRLQVCFIVFATVVIVIFALMGCVTWMKFLLSWHVLRYKFSWRLPRWLL